MNRDEIIAAHPLVEYCEARGWTMRRSGTEWSCRCPLPNHEDHTPSFFVNPDKQVWLCRGCGRGGSVIDLHMVLHNMTDGEAMADLGGDREFNHHDHQPPPKREKYDPFRNEEKTADRAKWPTFDVPTKREIRIIAELRGLSEEGVSLAVESGLLFCADSREGPRAWIITDSRRVNAQARRLDGGNWGFPINAKAKTLPGSVASWPIGIREAQPYGAIALVEGGPDLLAAFHLAWIETSMPETLALGKGVDVLGNLGVVAMFGATNKIADVALPLFARKRVRLFVHDDHAGQSGIRTWAAALKTAGAVVDGFSFHGWHQCNGEPVNDLNDFVRINVDEWEAERSTVESVFDFVPAVAPKIIR